MVVFGLAFYTLVFAKVQSIYFFERVGKAVGFSFLHTVKQK
jgi:hypothetical protein